LTGDLAPKVISFDQSRALRFASISSVAQEMQVRILEHSLAKATATKEFKRNIQQDVR
jgi:hypothetical protein